MPLSPEEYVTLGSDLILQLLDDQLAAPWLEVEARLADLPWTSSGQRVDPHHLSEARVRLERSRRLQITRSRTRGGRDIGLLQATGGRRATAIEVAARRKRLLMGRYLGWSQGSPSRPGLIGPAGERAVHASLLASGSFVLANPNGGQTNRFLDVHLPGALDNAGFYIPLTTGLPGQPVSFAVEVKNQRDWIYPVSQELYQLLDKAALLQRTRPQQLLVPILICRRAHLTAFRMAKDLGFFIIDTQRQYISTIDNEALNEVRAELGLLDLTADTGPDPRIIRRMTLTFPPHAATSAARWRQAGSDLTLGSYFTAMRQNSYVRARQDLLHDLRRHVDENLGMYEGQGW